MQQPLFVFENNRYLPTELAGGPWDPRALHGGAVAALMVERQARADVSGRIVRFTLELLKPVPKAPLQLTVQVARSGRQVQRTSAELSADGQPVARSEALHIAAGAAPLPDVEKTRMRRAADQMPGLPEAGTAPEDIGVGRRVTFARNAVEMRVVQSSFVEPGPGAVWFRLLCPVVDQEPPGPWARLVTAADFCNGISAVVPWRGYVFANADLTVAAALHPVGEWIGIHAVTHTAVDGAAIAQSQLFDVDRPVGLAVQSVAVRARPPRAGA
ncbi:MAG: thioesterase family protein [Pseudomonadota bacterium]